LDADHIESSKPENGDDLVFLQTMRFINGLVSTQPTTEIDSIRRSLLLAPKNDRRAIQELLYRIEGVIGSGRYELESLHLRDQIRQILGQLDQREHARAQQGQQHHQGRGAPSPASLGAPPRFPIMGIVPLVVLLGLLLWVVWAFGPDLFEYLLEAVSGMFE
jgi:hypothetical protein